MTDNVKMLNEGLATRYEDSRYGSLSEGYNEKEDVIVNVVSRKKAKAKYKVGGVLDQEQNNNWKAWLYLSPVLILMAVFLIFPLLNTMAIAFMKNYDYITGTATGITLDNFLQVLKLKPIVEATATTEAVYESNFVTYAIPNTIIIVFVTVPLSIFISLMISVLLNKIKWFQKIYQTVFFLPYVTNAIAVGMVFSVLFDRYGLINYVFHTNITWIYGAEWKDAMVPLVMYIVWGSLPFKILILLSGLQNVDKQYYDAAKIDSAPSWKVLWRITVPSLWPQILYLMVTSFIGAFKEYTAVKGLFNNPGTTPGKYELYTMVYYIYDNLNTHTARAAAAAVILFLMILAFTFLQLGINKWRKR